MAERFDIETRGRAWIAKAQDIAARGNAEAAAYLLDKKAEYVAEQLELLGKGDEDTKATLVGVSAFDLANLRDELTAEAGKLRQAKAA